MMRSRFWVVWAGFAVCAGTVADSTPPASDERVVRLETFFTSYGCAKPHHAADYVRAADAFRIDYRVLPAISLLESTCGAYGRRNNNWGWNSAHSAFESVPAGIAFVTSRLAVGPPYRDKALDQKLLAYNPSPPYVRKIRRLMTLIEDSCDPSNDDPK
jgi:hypothetical protein